MNLSTEARLWIYRAATGVMPLLVAYGVVEDTVAPLWLAALAGLLVPALAAANTHPED